MVPGLKPWEMDGFTFEELGKIDAAVQAARDARMDAARPSRQG